MLLSYNLIPVSKHEKLNNGEITTPYILRQDMLNLIPLSFWQVSRPIKIFEPCVGKGGFIVDIYNKLIQHSYLTKQEILMECLYFADINENNIFLAKKLLDPNDEYILNSYVGDTLKMAFDFNFDAVISNPPYNAVVNNKKLILWYHFTRISLKKWLKPNGLLLSVHPSGWRKPDLEKSNNMYKNLFKLMTKKNTMLNLVIRGEQDGKKMFKCGVKYDYYLIKKQENKDNTHTLINDSNYINHNLNLKKYNWLPNCNFKEVFKIFVLTSKSTHYEILRNTDYRPTAKMTENEEYKYKLIYSINKSGVKYMYSNDNTKGLFGISKIIFGDTRTFNDVIIDMDGIYSTTERTTAIKINTYEEGLKLKNFLLSDKFKEILKSCMWGNFRIEWALFYYLKRQ